MMLKSLKQKTDIHWVCSQCGIGFYDRPAEDECIFCGGLLEAVEKEEPIWKD